MVALKRYIDPVVNDNASNVARRGRDPTCDTTREPGISQHFALSMVPSEGAGMLSPARGSLFRPVISVSWDYIGVVDEDIGVVAKKIFTAGVESPTYENSNEISIVPIAVLSANWRLGVVLRGADFN
jgi:hypothetical protein